VWAEDKTTYGDDLPATQYAIECSASHRLKYATREVVGERVKVGSNWDDLKEAREAFEKIRDACIDYSQRKVLARQEALREEKGT
jgi:hypothetical protein